MPFPTPPLSGAGGALILQIRTPGVSKHRLKVHIPAFALVPEATAVVGNTPTDWAYNAPLPGAATGGSTLEPSVGQTAIDLMDAIKPLYAADRWGIVAAHHQARHLASRLAGHDPHFDLPHDRHVLCV